MNFVIFGKPVKHGWLLLAALILLVSFFSWGCGAHSLIGRIYPDAGRYKAGNFEYKASDVSSVEINWVSEDVTVKQSSSNTLSVKEENRGLNNRQKMHWRLDGDKLIIQYCKSGYKGRFPGKTKKLTVEIPENVDLTVSTVSGDVKLEDCRSLKTVDLNTVSGDVRYDGIRASKLDVDTVSGDVDGGKLYVDKAELNSTSGDFSIMPEKCNKLDVGTVSGDVALLTLPDGGASVDYSHASGDLHTGLDYESEGKTRVFGSGKCKISVSTLSGDLTIR